MFKASKQRSRAFSLIELVIVIVIIGIIAAIAVPRMSRGAAGATDAALRADLATLRAAIDLFHTEHEGLYPAEADIALQLTGYSNLAGTAVPVKDPAHIYGPYLRAIPGLPVNAAEKGSNGIAAIPVAGIGWIYTIAAGAGNIRANTTIETDDAGTPYNTY